MRTLFMLFIVVIALFGFENIDSKRFYALSQQKGVVILDVRTPSEFNAGHIAGANLIPLQLFNYIFLGGKGFKDKIVLVYCHSGNRSAKASSMLQEWGVKRVYNLKNGIIEWRQKGLPLVR